MESLIWFSIPGAVLVFAIVSTNQAWFQSDGSKVLAAVAVPAVGFCVHQLYRLLFELNGGFESKSRIALTRIQSEFAPKGKFKSRKLPKAFLIWETTFYSNEFPSPFRDHDRGAWRYILSSGARPWLPPWVYVGQSSGIALGQGNSTSL